MKPTSLGMVAALVSFVIGITLAAAWLGGFGPRAQRQDNSPTVGTREHAPSPAPGAPALEMVFALDTTGSMGGLIEGAKQRIWAVVNEVMQSSSQPAVRIGLVAYRDRGDEYVTKILPLTANLDEVYSALMDFRAAGGGDEPENVRRALADAVHGVGWSKPSPRLAQIVFLVGDAPPHEDYQDEPDLAKTAAAAASQGMVINTIQCGKLPGTRPIWQAVAARGQGQYFAIAQDGGVEVTATPYDARLAELGAKMGGTYLAYGGGGSVGRALSEAKQQALESKVARSELAATAADRAVNKAVNKAAYASDLLQSLENEAVKLDSVRDEDLPDELRKLAPAERKKEVERRLAERRALREQILALSKERDAFLAAERKKQGKKSGFDAAVAAALKQQLAQKGIK